MSLLPPNPLETENDGGYVPDLYDLPPRVAAISKAPRFNAYHCTSDFLNDQTRDQYVTGVLSATILVLFVYMIWAIAILVLKCLGPDRVGCASGVFRPPPQPVDPHARKEEEHKEEAVDEGGGGTKEGGATPPATPLFGEQPDEKITPAVEEGGGNRRDASAVGKGVDERSTAAPYFCSEDGLSLDERVQRGLDRAVENGTLGDGGVGDDGDEESSVFLEWPNASQRECAMPKEDDQSTGAGASATSDSVLREIPEGEGEKISTGENRSGDCGVALAEWEGKMRRYERRIVTARVAFLLSGCFVILNSALFYGMGVGGLNSALQTMTNGIHLAQAVLWNAHNLTEWFIESHNITNTSLKFFNLALDQCPELLEEIDNATKKDEIWKVLTIVRTNNSDNGGLGGWANATMSNLHAGFESAVHATNEANDSIQETISTPFFTSVAIMGLLNLFVLILMASVVSKWRRDEDNCVTRRASAVMPLFVVAAFLGWLCASIFIFVAVAGSDFCVAPDVHMEIYLEKLRTNLLTEIGYTLEQWKNRTLELNETLSDIDWGSGNVTWNMTGNVTNVTDFLVPFLTNVATNVTDLASKFLLTGVYDLAVYYVRQCVVDFLPTWYPLLLAYHQVVTEFIIRISDFLEYVESGSLEEICGSEKARAIEQTALVLHGQLLALWDSFTSTLQLLECKNINPIYNRIMHDALCVEGVDWLAWSFATVLCIAVFSMMMVSLRASWYSPFVAQTVEHVSKSAKGEGDGQKQSERRRQRCATFLWALLFTLMISVLVALITYLLNGYSGEDSREQCPAEWEQFSSH